MTSKTGPLSLLLARSPGGSGRHVERLPLAVAVRGRDDPDGVPLDLVLAAAQEVSPAVTGLAVSGTELLVTFRERPAATEWDRVRDLLGDPERLRAPAVPEAGAPLAALLDEATPDAEWMRLFRQWAVRELLARDGGG
ncbi:hypothetical protein ABZU75_35310 [Streptosporangium sp. NPDC005286]|uniref:hypothetical protein n=1 Tax=Streptosporangium sp. NPDC005286 TaxID=3154463 RepID=UPI0033B48A9C